MKLKIGKAQNQGKTGETINVDVDGQIVQKKAANEINTSRVVVVGDNVVGGSSPVQRRSQSAIKSNKPKKKTQVTYPIKVLAVTENDETQEFEFWLYGDNKPELIYSVDWNTYDIRSSKITKIGKKTKDWQVFLSFKDFRFDDEFLSQYHPSFIDNLFESNEYNRTFPIAFITPDTTQNPVFYAETNGLYRNTSLLSSVGAIATIDPYKWFDAQIGIADIDFFVYSSFYSPNEDLADNNLFMRPFVRGGESLNTNYSVIAASGNTPEDGGNQDNNKVVYYNFETQQFELLDFDSNFLFKLWTPSDLNTIETINGLLADIPTLPIPMAEFFDFTSYSHNANYHRLDYFGNGNFADACDNGTPEDFAITANEFLYNRYAHSPTIALAAASTTTNDDDTASYPEYYFTHNYQTATLYSEYEDSGFKYLPIAGFPSVTYNIELDGNYDPNNYNIYRFIPHELSTAGYNAGFTTFYDSWQQSLISSSSTQYLDYTNAPIRSNPDGLVVNCLVFQLFLDLVTRSSTYPFTISLATGKGEVLIHSPIVSKDDYNDNSIVTTFSFSDCDLSENNVVFGVDLSRRQEKILRLGSSNVPTISFFNATYPFKLHVLTELSYFNHAWLDVSIPFIFLEGATSFIIGVFEGKTYGSNLPPSSLTYDYTTKYYLHYKNNSNIVEITDYSIVEGDRPLYYEEKMQTETFKFMDIPIEFCSLIGNKIYVVDENDPKLNQTLVSKKKVNVKVYSIGGDGSIALTEEKYQILPLKNQSTVILSASFFV